MSTFKDSGKRADFGTGAVRDFQEGKGMPCLVPWASLEEQSMVHEIGDKKYASRNWEAGIPIKCYLNSAMRHLSKACAGQTDEPHLSMALWNIGCAIQTEVWIRDKVLPKSLEYDRAIVLCRDILANVKEVHNEDCRDKVDAGICSTHR